MSLNPRFIFRGFTRLTTGKNLFSFKLPKRSLSTNTQRNDAEDKREINRLFQGIIEGYRGSLAQGITLVETLHPTKYQQAQQLLSKVTNLKEEVKVCCHAILLSLVIKKSCDTNLAKFRQWRL